MHLPKDRMMVLYIDQREYDDGYFLYIALNIEGLLNDFEDIAMH
jgi:hypothetical protein